MARDEEREIIYVERGDGTLKPLLLATLIGMTLGFLFAPQSGEETRRALRRRFRRVRALAEEKVGELHDRITGEWEPAEDAGGEEAEEDDDEDVPSREGGREAVREDLERRLAAIRARRRTTATAGEDEEPVA